MSWLASQRRTSAIVALCSIAQTHNVVMLYNAQEWLRSCWRTWSTALSAIHSLLTVPLGICKKKMQTETLTMWFDDSLGWLLLWMLQRCSLCVSTKCTSSVSIKICSHIDVTAPVNSSWCPLTWLLHQICDATLFPNLCKRKHSRCWRFVSISRLIIPKTFSLNNLVDALATYWLKVTKLWLTSTEIGNCSLLDPSWFRVNSMALGCCTWFPLLIDDVCLLQHSFPTTSLNAPWEIVFILRKCRLLDL